MTDNDFRTYTLRLRPTEAERVAERLRQDADRLMAMSKMLHTTEAEAMTAIHDAEELRMVAGFLSEQ